MAEATPWQSAGAGQQIPAKPEYRAVFSHGTEPWPYAPHFEVVTQGTEVATTYGPYGVNNHQPS